MPLKRLGLGLWVGCLLAGPPLAAGAPAAAAAPPRAELRGLTCRRSSEQSGRMVAVTAVMRPLTGTTRMALKFELDRRTGRGAFRPVAGRQLGHWVSPANPTLGRNPADVWMLKQNVVNLASPAAYRFRVWFRWTGPGGRGLGSAMRVSPICRQPDLRADLVVRSIAIQSLGNGQDEYDAVVHNAGRVTSGTFAVELDPPGAASQSVVAPSLAPGANERTTFDAPACAAGSQVTAAADPSGQIEDADRANNALKVACPGGFRAQLYFVKQ